MISAISPGVAMQRSNNDGGSGTTIGLASTSPLRTYLPRTSPDAAELAALVVELLADFLADAPPLVRVGQHFGRVKDLFDDGQVFGDARRTRLLAALAAPVGILSRRSGVCRIGGGRFFCRVEEFELGRVELLAAFAEDAAAEGVDGLFKHGDAPVAFRDLLEQALPFVVLHLRGIP
jgi:hypothetical protein